MTSITLKRIKLDFIYKIDCLDDSDLAKAYKSLKDQGAPAMCIDIILDRMIDRLGIEEANRIVDTVD